MKKERLLKTIEKHWILFIESYTGLTEEQFNEKSWIGEWTVKDLLTHVNTWDEQAVSVVSAALEGEAIPGYKPLGGINAFNARDHEAKRDLPLQMVKQRLAMTHQLLLENLEKLPEQVTENNQAFMRRIRFDTYRHYREHAAHISDWRRQRRI